MKLKTGLQLGALFPIVMAILVSIGLVVRSQELEKVTVALEKADALVQKVSELQAATQSHLALRTEESEAEWWARHSDLGTLLDKLKFDSVMEQLCVERVRDGYDESAKTMRQLSRDLTGADASHERLLDRDKELVLDLADHLEDMTREAFRLARTSHQNSVDTNRETDYFVAPLFGLLALSMAAGVLIIGKKISSRMRSIRSGMGTDADGAHDHQIDVADTDEIDEVMTAFNSMNRQIKDSSSALNEQIEKHETVSEALRRSNMVMSDALVKLKRAQAQIVDNERLSALRQMAGGIAHDFNSSLTPILGLSDFMILCPETLDDKEDLMDNIKMINEAVRKARDQVKRLTEFFRPIEESAVEDVDINELVEKTVDLTKPRWKEEAEKAGVMIDVRTELTDVPVVRADIFALREMLTNLIVNSVEALPKGGQIVISTESGPNTLTISVKDDGVGMTEEVQRKCMEPFFSTKGSKAAGMGLTSSSAIARRYEGSIAVESKSGKGTTVTVSLPVKSGAPIAVEPEAEASVDLPKTRMLVVDDELWVRQVFTRAFGAEGHTVVTASNGEEGLEKFAEADFDVVILDRAMPKMSGDDVALAIKKDSDVPVILLTGFGDIMQDEGEMPPGIDLLVSKPATLEELTSAIASVLRS